jgi:hypothetical protein
VNTALLIEPGLGSLQDGQFLLQLSDPLPGSTQLGTLSRRITWSASVVNVILTQPRVQRHFIYAKISSGLLDLAAVTDKRNSSLTKFRWIGSWHNGEPFMKAID